MRSPVITEVKAGKFWRRIACWASGERFWRERKVTKLAGGHIVMHCCEFCEARGEELRPPARRVVAFLKAVQARDVS